MDTRFVTYAPVALVVLWSSGFIGAELGTAQAAVFTVLAWRYLVASAVLVMACGWRREGIAWSGVGRQAVLGLLCQAGYIGLVVGGVSLGVPAGTSALIAALQPLVVTALAAALLAERPGAAQLVGLGIGLAGVALVVSGDVGTGRAPLWAYALPFAGMLLLALGTVLEQRWRPRESILVSMTAQSVVTAGVFWALAGASGAMAPPATPGFWLAVAWVVVLSTFGAYGAYTFVTRTQGATRASTWLYLTPPTVMLWAALMFGDSITSAGLVGLVVCAAGVVLTLRAPRQASGLARWTLSSKSA